MKRWLVPAGLSVAAIVVATVALALSGALGSGGRADPTASPPGPAAAGTPPSTRPPLPSPRPLPTTRPFPTIDPFTPYPVAEPTYPPGGPWRVGPITFDLPEGWGTPHPFGLALIAYLSSLQDPDAGIYHMALPGGQVPSDLRPYRFFQAIDGHDWRAGLRTQVFDHHGGDAAATADEQVEGLRDLRYAVSRRTVELPIGLAQRVTWRQPYGSTAISYTRFLISAGDVVVAIDLGTVTPTTPAELLEIFMSIVRSAHV